MNTRDGVDVPLAGGWQTEVRRSGDTIRRTPNAWSASVIALLHHLGEAGLDFVPRPVGSGFDADGNELIIYLDGESVQPAPWSDDGIAMLGALLGELHAATRSFEPAADATWKQWFGRELGDTSQGIGHGDLGPWNIMAIDGVPVGFIDWDTAGPIDPRYELAQVAWLNVQLHDDDIADRVGLGDAHHRARQLGLLLDAYGADRDDRTGFVDRMIEVAVHDAASQAIEHGVTPDTTSGVADDGYPFAWGMAWRVRSAAWMLRHRAILEAAILP